MGNNKLNQNFFTNQPSSVSSNRVLYTPSSFARSSLLFLQETGSLVAKRPHTSSRVNLSSFLFFIVTSGSGELEYEGEVYSLSSGDCVFIDCEKAYSHSTGMNGREGKEEGIRGEERIEEIGKTGEKRRGKIAENRGGGDDLWSLKWCHFNGPEMKGIYDKYKARGGKPVFFSSLDYSSLLDSLYTTASSDSYVRDMKINSILSNLLTLLMEDSWNPNEIADKQKEIRKVRMYLEENYSSKVSLDTLSSLFYIDKFYLCSQFKEQYGVSVMDYLISVRITEAKKLIRFTDKTMDEIANSVGINGAAYFSRLFKKVEGVNPSEFRKMW